MKCFQDRRVSMAATRRMKDFERWHAVGRIEAHSVNDRYCSFLRRSSFRNFTIMETVPNQPTVVRRPIAGRPLVRSFAKDLYSYS